MISGFWLVGSGIVLKKVLPPCQHVSVDRPILQRSVMRREAYRAGKGKAVFGEIDHGQVCHFLLIAHRTSEVLLKLDLSLLPGNCYLGACPLQAAPFVFKMPSLLRCINRAVKKMFQVLRMKGRLVVRPSPLASVVGDKQAQMPYCQGCGKGLQVDSFAPKIKSALNLVSFHASRFHSSASESACPLQKCGKLPVPD